MTAESSATDDTVVLPKVEEAPAAPPAGPSRARRIAVQTGWAATLLSGLLLGFGIFLFGLSPLQEMHYQAAAHRTFQDRLANAIAPTGAATDGSPVAIIDIPRIGLHDEVVVEGTTGRDLMRGPGHRRDTALPGQAGVAVLFGRGAAFGGPFGRINELRAGDKIQVATAQGQFSYTVNAYGTGAHPILDPDPNRMVLTTSNSDWIPTSTVLVGARLDGDPQDNPGGRPAIIAADHALAQDTGALAALQLWSAALLGAVALSTLAARYWVRRAAYLACTPVLAALLWAVYENAAALLPNLY
ncbi:sortase [Kitasatospora viridis]|uniref:LPXTG-site transpeptidase (Sortase) family protein n=1 Tax=Kitasatospora viridis TaxID=281105 RepID=A0A561UH32_9ACTN|nr:class E sortase [Kitasatospora viridis]TWF98664.1 LPXTG-site transpeptidase (sortase) family protein [Kitasatospora viridis]